MEIFSKDLSGYEEIVSYGPKWWTEYKEMDAVYRYEGWCLDLMYYLMEQLIKNQFPLQADESAISGYEKSLKIEYGAGLSLEERRRIVAAHCYGNGKLSKSAIQSVIRAYTSCESDVWWNSEGILQIRVYADGEYEFSNSKIADIIGRRIPAHIAFDMRYLLCCFELAEGYAQGIRYRMPFVWWSGCLDGSVGLNGSMVLDCRYPTKFFPVYPYLVKTEEECGVKMSYRLPDFDDQNIFIQALRIRAGIVWWDGCLDGSARLDGTVELNTERPPFFLVANRMAALNDGEPFFSAVSYRLPETMHSEEAGFVLTHRMEFIWWAGREVLDGQSNLDGAVDLSQDTPPAFTKVIHIVETNNDEDIAVFMYNPAVSAVLDGSSLLDGELNLNSGREEL